MTDVWILFLCLLLISATILFIEYKFFPEDFIDKEV